MCHLLKNEVGLEVAPSGARPHLQPEGEEGIIRSLASKRRIRLWLLQVRARRKNLSKFKKEKTA